MRSSSKVSHSDVRASALWGAGSRKGELRSSALWGKGGRRFAGALLAVVALALPLAASAGGPGKGDGKDGKNDDNERNYVSPGLLRKAHDTPEKKIRVIIQSSRGSNYSEDSLKGDGAFKKRLGLIGAIAVELKAKKIDDLAKVPGITITPDSLVKVSSYSEQIWPYSSGNAALWNQTAGVGGAPTIAVVDSGVQSGRSDFGSRLLPQVNLSTLTPNATGDDRGHGTFVAGIAAGNGNTMAGAAPSAKILPIRVMDQNGMAMTSDVIRAAQWIFENKDAYNIRVANFSLHSQRPSQFTNDPLDKAVEKLWFSGVVVVAAAGNYGRSDGPSGVLYAPGNDPFVITVGATDIGGTLQNYDDVTAPFSAYGYTYDGFLKPEIVAPGRYIVGPVPATSTLVTERPLNVVGVGYMQLSGTSFAAPVVAGAAAQLLANHPTWTPDEVKGALMAAARPLYAAPPLSAGVGELNASKANSLLRSPPNPNVALDQFVVSASGGSGKVFDAASWAGMVASNASWSDASWSDASWSAASWSAASWSDASWSDASWSDGALAAASWADASWADASWADMSHEDAAEGEAAVVLPLLDAVDLAALAADPDLRVPTSDLPPSTHP